MNYQVIHLIHTYIAEAVANNNIELAKAFAEFKEEAEDLLDADYEESEAKHLTPVYKNTTEQPMFVPEGNLHFKTTNAMLKHLKLKKDIIYTDIASVIISATKPGSEVNSVVIASHIDMLYPEISKFRIGMVRSKASKSVAHMFCDWVGMYKTLGLDKVPGKYSVKTPPNVK